MVSPHQKKDGLTEFSTCDYPFRPHIWLQTLSTWWKEVLVERWFPYRVVSRSSAFGTSDVGPAWVFKHFRLSGNQCLVERWFRHSGFWSSVDGTIRAGPTKVFDHLLSFWSAMLNVLCHRVEYMALSAEAPHEIWNACKLVAPEVSWMMVWTHCCVTELSILHFLLSCLKGFQRLLSETRLVARWFPHSVFFFRRVEYMALSG